MSVDLEDGYGPAPQDVARAIARVAEAGAVGASIEDYDGRRHLPARARRWSGCGGREAARGLDFAFTLTARAENHIRGNPDLDDTIARLQAYERAGADVLYAPGLRSGEEIRAVCDAVSKPVNVLAHRGLSLSEIVEAGGQRISVGGALAWVAVGALVDAAERIRDHGDFSVLDRSVPDERLVDQRAHPHPDVVGAEEHLGEEEHGHVRGRVDPERRPGGPLPAVLAGRGERLGRDRVDQR